MNIVNYKNMENNKKIIPVLLNLIDSGKGLTTSQFKSPLIEFIVDVENTVLDEVENDGEYLYIKFHQYGWYDEYDCDRFDYETIQKKKDLNL